MVSVHFGSLVDIENSQRPYPFNIHERGVVGATISAIGFAKWLNILIREAITLSDLGV